MSRSYAADDMIKAYQDFLHILTVSDGAGVGRLKSGGIEVIRAVVEGRLGTFNLGTTTYWGKMARSEHALPPTREEVAEVLSAVSEILLSTGAAGSKDFVIYREAILAIVQGRLDPNEVMKNSGFLLSMDLGGPRLRLDLLPLLVTHSGEKSFIPTDDTTRFATRDEWQWLVRHRARVVEQFTRAACIYIMDPKTRGAIFSSKHGVLDGGPVKNVMSPRALVAIIRIGKKSPMQALSKRIVVG